jgi:hypothetical protein
VKKRLRCVALLIPALAACSGSSGGTASPKSSSLSPSTSSSSGTPKEHLVATFKGSSATTTKSFTVKKGWELRYEVEIKKPITVDLLGASGAKVARLASFKGPGGGSVYPSQTGAFSLKITSTGQWLVRVFNH